MMWPPQPVLYSPSHEQAHAPRFHRKRPYGGRVGQGRHVAQRHGHHIGIYVQRLLDEPLPWTRMRSVYRLLGLVRRYGPGPVEDACRTALDLDVVSVAKIAAMLARALETTPPQLPTSAGISGRFARDPAEFTTSLNNPRRRLTVVPDPIEEDLTP